MVSESPRAYKHDRAAAGGDGFIEPSHDPQYVAEIGQAAGILRQESDGLPDQLFGCSVVSALMGEQAQHVQGLSMVRLGGQNLPVKRLRFRQATGLVVSQRSSECLMDGHGEVSLKSATGRAPATRGGRGRPREPSP